MPLITILVEDGNGESEVVGVWLVANEEGTTSRIMLNFLKKNTTLNGIR
jgi:hypothetical protein